MDKIFKDASADLQDLARSELESMKEVDLPSRVDGDDGHSPRIWFQQEADDILQRRQEEWEAMYPPSLSSSFVSLLFTTWIVTLCHQTHAVVPVVPPECSLPAPAPIHGLQGSKAAESLTSKVDSLAEDFLKST
eukprot:387954-Rhodomonas_salina.4